MNELTAMVLRLAFFVLLWIFIFIIVGVLRSDMNGSRRKSGRRKLRRKAQAQPAAMGAGEYAYQEPVAAPLVPSAPPSAPHELIVSSGNQAGMIVALGSAPVTIGRAASNVLVIDDDFASGTHARIFPEAGQWYVEDLGSTNGTFIGDQRIHSAVPLSLNIPVTVGHSTVELRS